jgi:hypothetical protein
MKTSTFARRAALGIALLYATTPLVYAQPQGIAVQTAGSTAFMSGGVSQDEQALMRKAGKDFNLHFEFSEREDNEFIVGTELPDGQYRVKASYLGQNETRLVTLRDKAGQDLYFHWQGNPKAEPVAAVDAGAKAD